MSIISELRPTTSRYDPDLRDRWSRDANDAALDDSHFSKLNIDPGDSVPLGICNNMVTRLQNGSSVACVRSVAAVYGKSVGRTL